STFANCQESEIMDDTRIWTAVAERSGDTALAASCGHLRSANPVLTAGESKAVSPLRSATAVHSNIALFERAITRRKFLHATAAGVGGLTLPSYARKLSANEKLNIGVIGVAGRGGEDLNGVSSQNIVALCDVDDKNLAAAAAKFPSAKTYNDFRQLID